MRAIWVNEGAEVNSYDKLRQHGMTHVFFSERTHTRAHLTQARANGFQVGLYSNPQWYSYPDAKAYRDIVNRRMTALGVNDEQCDFQINYEVHNAQWIIDFFYWWRRVRRDRATSWSMEGFQAGWAWPAMNHPNLAGTLMVPQAYDGAMNPWDSAGVVQDLEDYGVADHMIVPFHDAKRLLRGWYGFAYMDHRLP